MRLLVRVVAILCFAAVLAQALLLRQQTRGGLFTQLPSASLAQMEQPKPAEDAFSGLGINDLAGDPVKVDNEFRLGLLPAGAGNNFADSASVLTFAGPALLLAVFTIWYTRPRKSAAH